MTGLFAKWERERQLSTMQKLQQENARLTRWKKINERAALVAWCAVFLLAAYLTYGDRL